MKLVSYAQNREDLLLHVLLHGVEKGFYVDVGANNPDIDSVTKFFYDRGWSGINIEPINSLYKELRKRRPRDINLNVGVSETSGILKLREFTQGLHGWSTFDKQLQDERSNQPHVDYEVPTQPLAAIFKAHKVRAIDFLKIDVEGLEFSVLTSNDWAKYRPKVIIIENSEKRCIKVLEKHGYEKVFFDGLNTYFVRSDLTEECTMNNYIPALLDGQEVMTARELQTQKQLKLTEKVLRQTHEKLQEIDGLYKGQRERIAQNPENYIGIKQLAKGLVFGILKRVSPKR